MTQLNLAALGSSFAAGPGIPPTIDRTAWRSGNNYAQLLARKFNAKLTDLTSSGATLLNVTDQPQGHILSSSPPQLDGLPQNVDIVTITAGGNDMGYIGGMMADAYKGSIHSVPLVGGLFTPFERRSEDSRSAVEVTERFLKVIDEVKARSPNATIYLVEYLTVLGPDTLRDEGNTLNDAQIRFYIAAGERLQQAYEDAAKARPGVELVRLAEMSKEHAVGSSEPWVTGFTPFMLLRGGMPYHPNALGHEVVADVLYEQIRSRLDVSRAQPS